VSTRLASPTFVGRREELSQLQAAAERAAEGEPGLVLVAGEAGVGKTRLVEEFAGWARERDFQVLVGGCVSLSADLAPFAPIVEALRPLARDHGPNGLANVLEPDVRSLAPVLPDLAAPELPAGSTGISPDTGSARLLEQLLRLLGRLASRTPIVLVVEDIQWADQSTVDVLAFLARNLRAEPILLVPTYRTDEPDSRRLLLPFLVQLGRAAHVERIDLDRLNRAEVAEQLGAILGRPPAPALTEAVYARSQGNAFFSEELLAADSIAGALPRTLRDALLARVGALSRAASEIVRVASAAGRRFSEDMLARLSDTEPGAFRAALREAIEHEILVREEAVGGERLGFRHALVRELLYADLLPSERRRLHAICARAIEETTSTVADPAVASELAYHWQAADEPERALEASIVAASTAESAGARAEAAAQFERALELLDRIPEAEGSLPLDRVQLLEHAAANFQADPRRAVGLISEALRLTDAQSDPVRAGLLQAALGRYLWDSGDGAGALAACQSAARLVPEQPKSIARAHVAAGLGQILMILAHFEEAVEYAEEAVGIAAATGARVIEAHALTTLGILTAYLGDVDGGLGMLRRAELVAKEAGSTDDVIRAQHNQVDLLIYTAARYDEAADLGLAFIGPADATMMTGVTAAIHMAEVAVARYLAGRWPEASDALERAQLQPAAGAGEIVLGIRAAQLFVGRGEFEKAAQQLAAIEGQLEQAADTQWIAPATEARAELAIWQGDPAAALGAVAAGLERVAPMQGANVSRIGPVLALGLRAAADVAEITRRGRSASDLETVQLEGERFLAKVREMHADIADRWPAHLRLADPHLAVCQAEASRLAGKSDPTAWATAADLLQGLGQVYHAAYARFREGEAALAVRRDAARARSALRGANATAQSIGAAPLQEAIRKVAARGRVELSGEVSHRAPAGGLTPREQEILRLVADGLTNRQIGDQLFITEKTASHHVSNILGKLGVSGRAEAAAASVRLGITPPAE